MTTCRMRLACLAAITAAWVAVAPAAAADPEGPPERFSLDQYSVVVGKASGSFQLGAGLTMGDSFRNGYYWFGGGRLSWYQVEGPRGGDHNGWALGGVLGGGYRPERTVSPVASLTVDELFGVDDFYESALTIGGGARVRVVPRLGEHYAFTFELYLRKLVGADGVADRSDVGASITYAVALFR